MMVKKYFALSLITAALTVAGCSSDDDDDNGDTGTVDAGTVDAGTVDAGTTDGGTDGTTDPEPVMDMSTTTGTSVLDVARGTDDDEDGVLEGGDENLSSLVTTLGSYPDLLNLLDDESQTLTVFAPNNDAFTAAADAIAALDEDGVKNVLQYHVITTANIDATAALGTLDTPITTANGGTVTISQDAGGALQVTDNDGNNVALGEGLSASDGNATVYIIGSVLAASDPIVEPGGDTEGDDSGGGDDSGTTTGGSGAAGTATAAIEGDASLSEYLAVLNATSLNLSLQDSQNDGFITIAPTNGNVDQEDATARDYLLARIINNAALNGVLVPGTYSTTGNTQIVVGGTTDAPTINGVPLVVVAGPGTTGGVVYSIDGDV